MSAPEFDTDEDAYEAFTNGKITLAEYTQAAADIEAYRQLWPRPAADETEPEANVVLTARTWWWAAAVLALVCALLATA